MGSGWRTVVDVLDRPTMRSLVVEVSDGIVAIAGALVVTSVFLARAGGTRVRTVLARTMLTATAAMSLSLLVGSLFHP